jgi:Ni/Co efflux regulator RcnB
MIEVPQENAMKSMSRLLLSLAAVAACATAHAAPFDSADQARRDRNREEVMAKHALSSTGDYTASRPEEKKTLKSESKRAVVATENFGHRTADRMREFGARTNAKFHSQSSPPKNAYDHGPQ